MLAAVAAALLTLTATGCGGSSGSGSKTVNWYVFKEPGGAFDAAAAKCSKDSNGRYNVKVVALPTDSDQQRELIVRRLAAKDKSIDVIGMDVNWTAEFAEAGWIVPWTGPNQQVAEKGVIPALLAPAQYKGQTWVAPFTTNTQLLFYHKDVVKGPPPQTWDEMIAQAQKIGGAKGKIVVQGRRYEGLTVWFNTLVASAGGQIVDRAGNTKLGPPAIKAATIIHDVATKAGTSSISNVKEDTGKDDFKANDLAFMVNYPFVYADVAMDPKALKNLGVARYPSVTPGQPSHVTVGGVNLGISKYSTHQQLAFEAAKCIVQPANQIVTSQKGGLAPTQASLYNNPQVKKAFPFAKLMQATLTDGVARPVLPAYADISLAVQAALHPPGNINPPDAIKTLVDNLKKAKEGKLF
ncbi:MAG: trehalose/maltose transport system substrate-binding protein [Thermoleophilaceae bacterium]|nr:trehalose/maltose transport system substrate-binding protein [Thermoleophilaceae bacterium]